MRQIKIDGHIINDHTDAYTIAEIGHNHMGNLEVCKRLFKAAKECGADAVKLQKRDNRTLFTKAAYNAPYINENSYGRTYGEHREALEFGRDEYLALKDYAADLEICFFATAFDMVSADFLAELDMPAFKLASWDCHNTPLIKHVAGFGKPILISTGGMTIEDVRRAWMAVETKAPLAFLHCTSIYSDGGPEPEEMNLAAIKALMAEFPHTVIGISDHYNGIVMSEAAYIMGARIIEKHFTLNHAWKGTDHALSLQPEGLAKLCRDLKRLKVAMGYGIKERQSREEAVFYKMGNAVHVAKSLKAGKEIEVGDVALKAPADGLPAYELDNVLGKIAICDLSTADILEWEALREE